MGSKAGRAPIITSHVDGTLWHANTRQALSVFSFLPDLGPQGRAVSGQCEASILVPFSDDLGLGRGQSASCGNSLGCKRGSEELPGFRLRPSMPPPCSEPVSSPGPPAP